MTDLPAHEAVNQYFAEAARILDLDPELHAVLTTPYREITVQVPAAPRRRRPDRRPRLSACSTTGPRALQGRHPLPPDGRPERGPGPRLADDVEDGPARPPLRRRQGRRRDRPHRHERRRAPAPDAPVHHGIQHVLGIYRDIPAPDVNTNAQTMAWMMDAFSATHGYSPAIVTGKPLDLGGAPGREAATGRGCTYVLDAWCEHHGLRLADRARGDPGVRQRRLVDGARAPRAGRSPSSACPTCAGRSSTRPASTSPPWWRSSTVAARWSRPDEATSSPTRSCSSSTATCSCRPPSAR